jgi:hypothetical protein
MAGEISHHGCLYTYMNYSFTVLFLTNVMDFLNISFITYICMTYKDDVTAQTNQAATSDSLYVRFIEKQAEESVLYLGYGYFSCQYDSVNL